MQPCKRERPKWKLTECRTRQAAEDVSANIDSEADMAPPKRRGWSEPPWSAKAPLPQRRAESSSHNAPLPQRRVDSLGTANIPATGASNIKALMSVPAPEKCVSSSSSNTSDFRSVIANLFLSNKLSAVESHAIAHSATASGATSVEDIAKCGAEGMQPGNLRRDILRKLLKDCQWPSVYWAPVRVKDPENDQSEVIDFPFLLPHEFLNEILQHDPSRLGQFVPSSTRCPELCKRITEFAVRMGVPPDMVCAIGLHGDGVPFKAKMSDSLEQLSWNLPAAKSPARILFTAIPKKYVHDISTWDGLFKIFSWSMRCLAIGQHPKHRHDGTEFRKIEDADRLKLAGQSLNCYGALIEIRGDWAFYAATFQFPNWQSKNVCWQCGATKDGPLSFRNARSFAPWRATRYERHTFLHLLRAQGLSPSTIFESPGLDMQCFMVDWLHAVDLGIGADIVGNVWNDVLELLPGRGRSEQISVLFARIKEFYAVADPPSKLDRLTSDMIKIAASSPKLRSKAGECRYLYPFTALLAKEFASANSHFATVISLMEQFMIVVSCVSSEPYQTAVACAAARKTCLLYEALEKEALAAGDLLHWHIKPKFHMFTELIEYNSVLRGNPAGFWAYADETWGGWLSAAGMRRGGAKFAASTALNLLQRFRAVLKDTHA